MRLENIYINASDNQMKIQVKEQPEAFAIVVCDGQARLTTLPAHGETKIITHQGKVKRIKWDLGEDF